MILRLRISAVMLLLLDIMQGIVLVKISNMQTNQNGLSY